MKKMVLVVLIGLFLGTAAFADHPGFGIGIVDNFGWGYGLGVYNNIGLSLKIPNVPIMWGFYFHSGNNHFGTGVTGDFYIIDQNFVNHQATNEAGESYRFLLDWYFGPGFLVNMRFWEDNGALDLGLRLPIGISWHIIPSRDPIDLELFLGLVPKIGFFNLGQDDWGFGGGVGGEVGLRIFFGAR